MTSLVDPTLDLVVRGIDLQFVRDLSKPRNGSPALFNLVSGVRIVGPDQSRHRLAMACDDDLAALLDLIHEARQVGLGLENPNALHGHLELV